tara:strand:+ start:173196 stop:173540 length:345 start_codon:yes stop_codon:yes gene_type:complete
MEFRPVAVFPLNEAKLLQDQLKAKGVEVRLEHNEATCTRGCAVTVEFHAKVSDIDIIREVITENFVDSLEGHEVDWKALSSVYDSSQKMATCPACATEFETTNKECPECGLVLG